MTRNRSQSGFRVRKNRRKTIYKIALSIVLLSLIIFLAINIFQLRQNTRIDRRDILELWSSGDFEEVYWQSRDYLAQRPLDYFFLTINGFSSYQLAIAQINNQNMQNFIDSAIWSLRKALLLNESDRDGRLYYVLGKAYFYKGSGYGDLAIKYLEKAIEAGYEERDIPEYLGLSYISVRDYRSSVAAFAKALSPEISGNTAPSDTLLLSIARSYIALGEDDAAHAYIIQCLETSRDLNMIINSRLLLGEILSRKGDFADAEEQFVLVIEESGGNAEAHFRLGELFFSNGETIRARAEWRRAIQIDPAHPEARSRLGI